jgi:hypothetical protein
MMPDLSLDQIATEIGGHEWEIRSPRQMEAQQRACRRRLGPRLLLRLEPGNADLGSIRPGHDPEAPFWTPLAITRDNSPSHV